jgi:hypothetical protein
MSDQRFTISRAIALSLSVTLLTAAPLLCMHPISAQIRKAQGVAVKHDRERRVVPDSRLPSCRVATIPRPASAQGPLAHTPRRDKKEEVVSGENHFGVPVLVEVTGAAGPPLPEPTCNEPEVPGMRATSVSPEPSPCLRSREGHL